MNNLFNVSDEVKIACKTAIQVWGKDVQLLHSMAECGEYIAAVGRYKQGRDIDARELIQESCDVIILMLQIRTLLGEELFDEYFKLKFEKFKNKVNRCKKEKEKLE